MMLRIFLIVLLLNFLISNGSGIEESTDINDFRDLMQHIFIRELGEDLRKKIESISNEGVYLRRTNEEIEAMVKARLSPAERERLKKAFKAVSGPTRKFARHRAKGKPVRITRTSQFRPTTSPLRREKIKPTQNRANKVEL